MIALGAFDLLRPVARGGMARVWEGVHRRSGAPAAIKVIMAAQAREMSFRVRFAHEVRAVARLDHPAVVRVYDHGTVPAAAAAASGGALPVGVPYLAMEWIAGGAISTGPAATGWRALCAALLTLLDGLAHAHARGVVHRDLKDDNVLLAARGPVLTDFGLAVDAGRLEGEAAAVGTPGYMAPEQIRSRWRLFGPPTDLYALGCLGWRLWCGAVPYGDRPRQGALALAMAPLLEVLPAAAPRFEAPAGFEDWLRRLLAREPEARFAFAADAAAALRALERPAAVGARLPADWRAGERPSPPLLMVGVGRTLFGHRVSAPIGREGPRDRLWSALRAVERGAGTQVVLIEGASGHGKTHLADWLAERAHAAGAARVLRATHQEPPGRDSGLGAMLVRALRVAEATAEEVADAVQRLPGAPRDAAEVAEIGALVAGGALAVGEARVLLTGPAEWDEAFARAVAAFAADRPLLIVADDVQWGASTRRTIAALAARHPRLPVLWVLTVRSDAVERHGAVEAELDALRARPEVTRVQLGPLDAEAHRRLLRAMLPIDPALAEALAERAAGNPLFGAELLRYWIGAGLLVDGPAGYRLAAGAAEAIPRGLQAVWTVRLADALGEAHAAALPALEVAATLGLIVDGDEWTAACAAAGVSWPRRALERLLDARLVAITEDGRWAFPHAMLRETLQAQARIDGRAVALEAACAEMLRARPDAAPSRLAGHLLAAGRDAEAIAPLAAATEAALLAADVPAARRLVGLRLAALRRLRIRRGDPRWLDLGFDWMSLDRREGRLDRAARRGDRLLAAALGVGDPYRAARALTLRGAVRYYRGDAEGCLSDNLAALPFARANGDREQVVVVLAELASTATFIGRLDEAEAALREALVLLDDGALPERRAMCLYYLGGVMAFRGREREGIVHCRAARALWAARGVRQHQAISYSLEGDLHRRLGDLATAEACYATFFALARMVGPPERAYRALDGALIDLARGRFVEARRGFVAAEAEKLTTARAVIAAGLLACAGGEGDWLSWDALAIALPGVVAEAPVSPDVPWAAEMAAGLAAAAGEAGRAAFARGVAAAHRRRLGQGGG
ncbi:MAG: serine/threonine-protein kinase PknK [Myxococcales bacterium]|nr:serine/threonine-protein kinase PknK [Myxococcales bacterium]